MKRYEVRGDHPATGTTASSGRVTADAVERGAGELARAGCVNITVVDHETGAETPLASFEARRAKD